VNRQRALTIWKNALHRFHRLKRILKAQGTKARLNALRMWKEIAKRISNKEAIRAISEVSKRFIVLNSLFAMMEKNIAASKLKAFFKIKTNENSSKFDKLALILR
jgi:ERCC4-related helicase